MNQTPAAALAPPVKTAAPATPPTGFSLVLPPTNSSWQIGPPLATDPEWMPKLAGPIEYTGWYGGLEVDLLKPKIFSSLTTPAGYGGPTISQPVGTLDWSGAPTVTAGYRFGNGSGELQVAYRLLAADGRSNLPGFDAAGAGSLRSRLNANTLDIDYVCPEFLSEGNDISPAYFRDLKFGFGVRTASLYFDTKGVGPQILEQHISSEFSGVGPRTFVELHRDLTAGGLQAYGRLDASGVVGPIKQRFFQSSLAGGAASNASYDTGNRNTGVAICSLDVGLCYVPPAFDGRLRLSAGYTYEQWYSLDTDDSNAKLSVQGLVLKAELRY